MVHREHENFSKVDVWGARCRPDDLFCNVLSGHCVM